jgi:integrase
MSEDIRVKVHSYGKGRALSLVYRDPVTGKKIAKSSGTTDEGKAERLAGELEKELQAGRYAAPSRITWQEFRDRCDTEKLGGMPASSQVAYTVALNHLGRVVAPDRLCKLTAPVISRFIADLRKEGMKPTTIARHLRHIKACLRWAERQGMMSKAPAIEMPKLVKGQSFMKGRPVTTEEYERLLLAVPKVRPQDAELWQQLLTGLFLSGLRLSEALTLDWEEGLFCLDLSGKHPVFRIEGAGQKSRRAELAPATPDFCEWVLTTFPAAERTGRVFKLTDPRTGKPLSVQQAGRTITKVGKRAKVVISKEEGRFATAHDLRRSFCTRWSKKVMPAVLQRLARHANITTTLTFYVAQNAADIASDLWASWASDSGNNAAPGNKTGNIAQETTQGVKASDRT